MDAIFPMNVGKNSRDATYLPRISWGEALVRWVPFYDLLSQVSVNVGLLYKDNVDVVGVCLGEGNFMGFWYTANV